MSRAASLPGAELFSRKFTVFEETTCPGQLRCLGAELFSRKSILFLKKPLVRGSFAAWARTFSRKLIFWKKPLVPGSFVARGRTFLKKRTFRNSGTPVRRTRRRKSKKMDFQELWDSRAQNKTSEIPNNVLSGIP